MKEIVMSKLGTALSFFFLSITLADIETWAKIVAAILAIGAASTTWYYNHLKIKQHRKEERNGIIYNKKK